MYDDASLEELLAGLRAGRNDAATAVFRRYSQRLIGLARSRLHEHVRHKEGDEDVVQSVLLSFFDHHAAKAEFETEAELWTHLLKATLRHCDKRNKRARAAKRSAPEVPLQNGENAVRVDPQDTEPSPEEVVALADTVEAVLRELNPRQRQIFELRLQSFTTLEIADRVGCVERTVFRELDQIRKTIDGRV